MRKRKTRQPLPVWVGWSLFILIAACLLGWYTSSWSTSTSAEAFVLPSLPSIGKPVVRSDLSGMSKTLVAGATNDLYKFSITSIQDRDMSLKRLTFSVNISSYTSDHSGRLSGFALYRDGVDMRDRVSITGAQSNTDNSTNVSRQHLEGYTTDTIGSIGFGKTWVNVQFGDMPTTGEDVIAPKTTVSYVLRAFASTDFKKGDSVAVQLLGDTTKQNPGAGYIRDNDPDGGEWVTILSDKLGNPDYSDVEFIWSGMYASSHSAAFKDSQKLPISSGDWFNGYLVKNFPLPALLLTV